MKHQDDDSVAKEGKQEIKMKKGPLAPILKLSLPPPNEASLSKFMYSFFTFLPYLLLLLRMIHEMLDFDF